MATITKTQATTLLALQSLDLTAVGRIRLVADGKNTGQAVAAEAYIVTADSIG
jgi:phosphotransferase system HPr-like phosphotransfer protein